MGKSTLFHVENVVKYIRLPERKGYFIPYSSVREAKSILFVCKIQIETLMFLNIKKYRVIGIVKLLVTAKKTYHIA